ncbi:MAG: hypothetical protein K6F09_04455 [Clostridiales bacterium]|nr:hypothetical protein [Clostridiales bacterium]
MKKTLLKIFTLALSVLTVLSFASCGKESEAASSTEPETVTEAKVEDERTTTEKKVEVQPAMPEKAAAAYSAFLGRFDGFATTGGSVYASDINADGYPEIIAKTAYLDEGELRESPEQFFVTYTDKAGLSVIYPHPHSSEGVHFRISDDNCIYYTDDGHDNGTAAFHSGYVYCVDENGFLLMGSAFGDEWPDKTDHSDEAVLAETDKKYDGIFENKIKSITGERAFVDCMNTDIKESPDSYLNEKLGIDLEKARKTYEDAKESFKKSVTDEAGKEPQVVFVSDYDRNGTYEAFAFVKESEDYDGTAIGSAWFAPSNGKPKKIQKDVVCSDDLDVISSTYHDYFQTPLVSGSALPTGIWEVVGNDCQKVGLFDISETGLEILNASSSPFLPPDTLISTLGAFDFAFADDLKDSETGESLGVGHTHKPYFFRDTPDGIKEYGGIEVGRSDIETIPGGKKLIKLAEKDGRKLESIFYRENGILSCSMSKRLRGETDYYCMDLLYLNGQIYPLFADGVEAIWDWPEGDENLDEYLIEGYYIAAASPDNATYPEKMG